MANAQGGYEPDAVDWRLLAELQADARLSFNELSRRVHLSAPSVAERVRRLQEAGIIAGYRARVEPAAVGQAVRAFVQLRCRPAACLLRTTAEADYPEVAAIHRLSGEYCTLLEIRAVDLPHFEGVIERIGTHGELRTHVVLSTQYEGRPVAPLDTPRPVTPSAGWSARP